MNTRHEKFCSLYANGLSASEAYIKAGYSKKGAGNSAFKLLKKTQICAKIAELREKCQSKRVCTKEDLLAFHTSIVNDPNEATRNRHSCAESIAKLQGFNAADKVNMKLQGELNINMMDIFKRLKERGQKQSN